MVRAHFLRKIPGRCLACILFMEGCAAFAVAQQPPKPHASPVPWLIILPPKIVVGAPATLAVLDFQGRLLPHIAVELPDGQNVTTGVTGRAMFMAPDQPGRMIAKISSPGIHASATVVAIGGSAPQAASPNVAGGVAVLSYPHVVALRDRFTLEGSGFRGTADSNHVYLNGEPCLIVASSPVSIVALPGPRVPIGEVTLHVTVAGAEAGQFSISAVQLEFSGPEEVVNAGSTGQLTLRARGTTEPLVLEVRNASPAVIQLSKGNVQRVKTSGGDENIAPVEVKFVTDGNYVISARLISADPRRTEERAR